MYELSRPPKVRPENLTFGGFCMAKYSFELKMRVVTAYLQGKGGYDFLANYYGIKGNAQVRRWVNRYKEFGEESLRRKTKNKAYSVQLKLDAVEYYLTTEKSYQEVACVFEIENPTLITRWVSEFRKDGTEGLSGTQGRPRRMSKKATDSSSNKPGEEDSTRIQELEKQVRYLQIENAYLKELRRLRREETRQKTNDSQESSTTSEDNSN